MSEELKPCPFCGTGGGAIDLYKLDGPPFGGGPRYWVSCCICGCAVGLDVLCSGAFRPFFATAEDAREAWNRRTNER